METSNKKQQILQNEGTKFSPQCFVCWFPMANLEVLGGGSRCGTFSSKNPVLRSQNAPIQIQTPPMILRVGDMFCPNHCIVLMLLIQANEMGDEYMKICFIKSKYMDSQVVVSNMFLCSPLSEEMIQFDAHSFQMGWNHQLDSGFWRFSMIPIFAKVEKAFLFFCFFVWGVEFNPAKFRWKDFGKSGGTCETCFSQLHPEILYSSWKVDG